MRRADRRRAAVPPDPGLRSLRASREVRSGAGVGSAARDPDVLLEGASRATWLWPMSTSGAEVARATRRRRFRRARSPRPGHAGAVEDSTPSAVAVGRSADSRKARDASSSPRRASTRRRPPPPARSRSARSPENAEIVVAGEGTAMRAPPPARSTRAASAVADDVAETPDRVGPLVVDLRGHRLERVKIGMNVGDDDDAHRAHPSHGRSLGRRCGVALADCGARRHRAGDPRPDRSLPAGGDRARPGLRAAPAVCSGSAGRSSSSFSSRRWSRAPARPRPGCRGRVSSAPSSSWCSSSRSCGSCSSRSRSSRTGGAAGRPHRARTTSRRRLSVARASLGTLLLATSALLAAIGLERWLDRRWWLAGAPVLAALEGGSVSPSRCSSRCGWSLSTTRGPRRLGRGRSPGRRRARGEGVAERTRTLNAEVAGIGPTSRVVIWETALDGRLTPARRSLPRRTRRRTSARNTSGGRRLARAARASGGVDRRAGDARLRRDRRAGRRSRRRLTVVAWQLVTLPLQSAVSRRYEAEGRLDAVRSTGCPPQAPRSPSHPAGDEPRGSRASPVSVTPRWTHLPVVDRIALACRVAGEASTPAPR